MKKENTVFKMDYNRAYNLYPDGVYLHESGVSEYHPAYITSNEQLRESVPEFGNLNGDVLTVAASGDQPMLYAMHGARRVDTFDMTYCAKVIMDIKTAALGQMKFGEYRRLLNDLADGQFSYSAAENMISISRMERIVDAMPRDSAEFLRNMSCTNMFSRGYKLDFVLSASEYEKMQSVIKAPFNFIWADVTDLHMAIDAKYNIINISNILEWLDDDVAATVLCNLFGMLRRNGYVVAVAFRPYSGPTTSAFRRAAERYRSAAQVHQARTRNETVYMLQRTR